jgi:hypothetical protein
MGTVQEPVSLTGPFPWAVSVKVPLPAAPTLNVTVVLAVSPGPGATLEGLTLVHVTPLAPPQLRLYVLGLVPVFLIWNVTVWPDVLAGRESVVPACGVTITPKGVPSAIGTVQKPLSLTGPLPLAVSVRVPVPAAPTLYVTVAVASCPGPGDTLEGLTLVHVIPLAAPLLRL